MKNAFVTGGTGFIGSHLVETLVKKGFNVKVLAQYNINNKAGWLDKLDPKIKKNLEIIFGDIKDPFLISSKSKKTDVFFNLAALISIPYSYESPIDYINTNVIGSINCLEAVRKNDIPQIIHTSTSEVYGTAQSKPISEKHPLSAQSPYAASKISADQVSMSYFKSFNTPVTIIRPFNTFGPRQSLRAVLPIIFSQVVKSKKQNIDISLGNIKARRDFTYVTDTVSGFIKAIGNKKSIGEVINLGTGHDFSIKDAIKLVEKIENKKITVLTDKKRIRPPKSEVNLLIADNSKAKSILNWKPKFSGKMGFLQAIKKTIAWYKKEDFIQSEQIKTYHK